MTPVAGRTQPLLPILHAPATDGPTLDVTSLAFDDDGEYFLTSSDSGRELRVWSCEDGTVKRKMYMKQSGIGAARFAHRYTGIVHSATQTDNHIRYLSTHENKYIRNFHGHEKKVNCIEVSPVNDEVLSSAPGDSVRLWDLRTPNCQGLLKVGPGKFPHVAWDPSGLVFGLSVQNGEGGSADFRLYDARNYEKVSKALPKPLIPPCCSVF